MSSSSRRPVNLDLSTQRLFIHPESTLPKFYPVPKAVMVTPVYDYEGPLSSPPISPTNEEDREALYMYGFNVAHDAIHNPARGRSQYHGQHERRWSSYSPGRGRSRRKIDIHTNAQPQSQSFSGPTAYRSRPSTDPLAQHPPDYQILATGVGGFGKSGRSRRTVSPYYHDSQGSSSDREWAMRSRPSHDPIAQNPPDYQIQATGQAGNGGGHPSHPHSAPAYGGSHSGGGQRPMQTASPSYHQHGRECDPPHSVVAYGSSHHDHSGGHHGGGRYGGHHTAGGTTYNGNANHVTHGGIVQSSHAPAALHSSKFPLPGIIKNKLETRHAKNKRKFDSFVQEYLKRIPLDPEFRLSRCTGGKRAVCIGINYVGQRDSLKGCANDARAMRDWLIKEHHFHSSNIILLTDDDKHNKLPTRKAIFEACMWLAQGAQKDDSLFLHYSGHGGQSPDASGREADGMDETIFPVDFEKEGDIIDDELHLALVRPLPAGCRLTAVFDSCHSGTILDLPYMHSAHGRLRSMKHISKRAIQRGVAPKADVVCFAACRDDEKAADTFGGGFPVGAMSHALLETLYDKPNQTYDELITHLRELLVPKYGQKAQFSGSHPMDLDERFTL